MGVPIHFSSFNVSFVVENLVFRGIMPYWFFFFFNYTINNTAVALFWNQKFKAEFEVFKCINCNDITAKSFFTGARMLNGQVSIADVPAFVRKTISVISSPLICGFAIKKKFPACRFLFLGEGIYCRFSFCAAGLVSCPLFFFDCLPQPANKTQMARTTLPDVITFFISVALNPKGSLELFW